MSSPLVSVIMSAYNHAEFVAQAMESVLKQRGVDFEFLITDDGSVDGTPEKIAAIKDQRITFFPYRINRGACIATNELVTRARGEYIALINSDDYWIDSDKLVRQVDIVQNNPELAACFGKADFVDRDGISLEKSQFPFGAVFDQENRTQAKWLRYFFDNGNCLCHPTILIRRSCYEQVGLYNNRLRQLPDFEMWIRLVKKYPIYILDQKLIHFRILPGENASSQTTSNSIRTLNEHYLIANQFFDEMTSAQLIEGFGDCLIHQNGLSEEHCDIEKALLYFHENQWLGRPYSMIGLQKMFQLLNSEKHRDYLAKDYDIDDRWFQKKMGELDILSKLQNDSLSTKSRRGTLFNKIFGFLT